jgi:hypothetical protein
VASHSCFECDECDICPPFFQCLPQFLKANSTQWTFLTGFKNYGALLCHSSFAQGVSFV